MNTVRSPGSGRSISSWHGLGLAVALAAAFLLISAFQTLATFFIRMYESDVVLGSIGNFSLVSGMTVQLGMFCAALVGVHLLFALLVFAMARVSEYAWPKLSVSRFGLVTFWFVALVSVVILLNGAWYPRSHSGAYYHGIATSAVGTSSVAQVVSIAVLGLAGVVTLVAITRHSALRSVVARGGLAMLVVAGLAILVGAVRWTDDREQHGEDDRDRPNIVIIGVDSLRLEYLGRLGGRGLTPAIDEFLVDASLFQDAITPLARTFPSWISILTGRGPRSTGAIFNLVRREDVEDAPTLGDILSREGYGTYFATDEVRFSNIDRSYGFDEVVTPPIGAADFLIGRVGDLPLSNVLSGSPIGPLLLSYVSANRGVAFLYQPSTFIERLEASVPEDGPSFVAIHLTAAHWPYYHADSPDGQQEQITDDSNPFYEEGLKTADRMFGDVVRVLENKGVLDNAIVIVLSDHGEALATPGDSLLKGDDLHRVQGLQVPARILNWGHGQSVLSPVQYQVLLAFRGFGDHSGLESRGRILDDPASLEDVVPTVLELLHIDPPAVDGVSHADALREYETGASIQSQRIRFTETDVRVAPSADGTLDEDEAAKQAGWLFAVDSSSGWLHLRPAVIATLMLQKERAALDDSHLLAAMPVAPDRHQYLLVNRQTGHGRVLPERPDQADPVALRLWDALHAHFGDELRPPVVVGPQDQDDFNSRWVAATRPAREPVR